ncbi:MAG: hypothetical protein M3O46_03105 [Myxococcota bacterium]|nr:hypothetical protein [Myxococcota bacterium]
MSQSRMRSLSSRGQAFAVGIVLCTASRAQGAGATPEATAEDWKRACVTQHEEAQLLRQDGKLTQARAAMIACSDQNCPLIVSKDCSTWLESVTHAIPAVIVRAKLRGRDEDAVRVTIDGEVVALRLDGLPFSVNPGLHTFRFEVSSEDPIEEQVTLAEGESRTLDVRFGHPEPVAIVEGPPPEMHRPVPKLAFVLGGVSVAGIVGFAGFGLWGLTQRISLQSSCSPTCSDGQVSSVRTKLLAADVSLGIAAVAAAGGAYVYLNRSSVQRNAVHSDARRLAPSPRTTLALTPSTSGAMIGLQGAF